MKNNCFVALLIAILLVSCASPAQMVVNSAPADNPVVADNPPPADNPAPVDPTSPEQLITDAVGGDLEVAQAIASQGLPLDQQVNASLMDGNVVAIELMQTIRGVMDVYRMAPGSGVLQSIEGNYLLTWAVDSNNYGFLALDKNGQSFSILNAIGGKCNCYTLTDLMNYLSGIGWKQVMPTELPAWLTATLGTAQAFVAGYGSFIVQFPVILIMPGGGISDPFATHLD